MLLDRRKLLATGSVAGLSALVYGCGQTQEQPGDTPESPQTGESAVDANGDAALYDASPIEPIDNQPINNPAGFADRPLGGVGADVTLVEYVSPTCPFCAQYHASAYPRIKETYVDTGRIRYIVRPFHRNALDLAVFMIAESAGTAYHDVLAAYLARQPQWSQASNPRQAIFEIAQQFGFTQERFEEILTDEELFAALEATREQAVNEFGLAGTPTFYLNGQRLETNATFESLSAEIDARL